MNPKNLTHLAFGVRVTSLEPSKRQMTIIVRGRFRLRPGEPVVLLGDFYKQVPLQADEFETDDDERTGECVYPGDFADFKLGSEVMLRGTWHAPGARPTARSTVRFTVGAWSKALAVRGRRVWTEKVVGPDAISEPEPFVRMPLRYANAYGGPGFADNPVGKGHGTPELPNLELPDAPIRSRRDRPVPASFGPINPAWPQRSAKVGKEYGAQWRKERFPFYAEDFDWSYFHAAPADQQLGRYLRGDEEMIFENLHPAAPVFKARLPGLRIRVFARTGEPEIAEPHMNLDTVFADTDAGTLTLTWRGLVPVREDDLADVKTLLIGAEPLTQPPVAAARYHAALADFEADPLEKDKRLSPEMKAAKQEAARGEDAAKPAAEAVADILRSGAASQSPEVRAAAEQAIGSVQAGLGKLDALKAANANAAAPPSPASSLAEQVQKVRAQLGALRERLVASGAPPDKIADADRLLATPGLATLARPPPPEVEPGPGADLLDRDLSGQDFQGRDLSGANLTGARLLKTRLAGAKLTGANLRQALLAGADLEGADLSGADLSRAALFDANLRGTILTRARLDGAIFEGADLSGATLEDAHGNDVVLGRAKLAGVHAQRVTLRQAISIQGDLQGADFRSATLLGCSFTKAKGQDLQLEGATLDDSVFTQSDLSRLRAVEVHAPRTVWRGATLDGADLRWSHLVDARFDGASVRGALLSAANLRGAGFYRAALDRTVLRQANLFGANLAKASLTSTSFEGANLYSAILLDAAGEDVVFTGANLASVVKR
jgi:uncharacterized protein YjbI with pentapeptide repeats